MKSADIKIGEVYLAKVSGQLQRVRVTRDFTRYNPTRHGWRAVNLATGRELRIKSSQRLRPLVDTELRPRCPEAAPMRPASESARLELPADLGDFMRLEVNRNVLRYAVQRNMFCNCCEEVLDVRRAAHIDARTGYAVMCGNCLDKYRDRFKPGVEIIDGRELEKAGAW